MFVTRVERPPQQLETHFVLLGNWFTSPVSGSQVRDLGDDEGLPNSQISEELKRNETSYVVRYLPPLVLSDLGYSPDRPGVRLGYRSSKGGGVFLVTSCTGSLLEREV